MAVRRSVIDGCSMGICMDGSALRSLTGVEGLSDGGGGFLCRMRVICHIGRLTDALTIGDSSRGSSYVSVQDASGVERR